MNVSKILCEHYENPTGLEVTKPRLSWQLESADNNQLQSAYQVLVASSQEKLDQGNVDIWDSGKVNSDQSQNILFSGSPLVATAYYYWKVRVWDSRDQVSQYSKSGQWSVGLLEEADWQAAQWIGRHNNRLGEALYLRKPFNCTGPIARATAFFTGLGYSELSVNGLKVSDELLSPAFTDYEKRVNYQTYDITDLLAQGENDLSAVLGGGFYQMATPDIFEFEKSPWTSDPKLRLSLKIEYMNRTIDWVISDDDWKCGSGPIVFNCVRGGETVDFRINDVEWKRVDTLQAPQGKLYSQQNLPIKKQARLPAKEIRKMTNGNSLYVFEANIAGWVRFRARGKRSTLVTLQHAELLVDGELNLAAGSHTLGRYQRDELILSGDGWDAFEPCFTYHGFQYVEVSGLDYEPALEDMEAISSHADMDTVGQFECAHDGLNRFQDAFIRTSSHYVYHRPMDPVREKMGWIQDVFPLAESYFYNYRSAVVFENWLNDMADNQDENGHLGSICPSNGWGRYEEGGVKLEQFGPGTAPGRFSDPWWGGALIEGPWLLYQYFGDKRCLEKHYERMVRYVDFITSTAKDGMIDWWIGDWGESGVTAYRPHETPITFTSTAGYFYLAKRVSEIAQILSYYEDANRFRSLSEKIRSRFNQEYLDSETGQYAKRTQTSQALPLYIGIVPNHCVEAVVNQLLVRVADDKQHATAGFVGLLPLLRVLTTHGHADIVFKIATQTDIPSWLFMVNEGTGGTLWEFWSGADCVNIPALSGPLASWLYIALAGIQPHPDSCGFKRILIAPQCQVELDWAKGSYNSPYGRIASEWRKEHDIVTLHVEIPVNTCAEIKFPSEYAFHSLAKIECSGHCNINPHSVDKLNTIEVGAGQYSLKLRKRP